jgi:PAS domain-containing protein
MAPTETARQGVVLLRSMIDTAPDALITIDPDGRVGEFGPAAERMFGYRAAEVSGRNVNMLMSELERAGLAAHHPLAGHKVGVVDRVALRRQHRLVEPGGQHVDQVDIRGELVVLLPGDAGRDEDAEVADLVMDGVDDGLAPGADVVDALVEVEDPAERLLLGVILSPFEQNTTIGERMERRSIAVPSGARMFPAAR